TVKTNDWIHANQDKAKASANARLEAEGGKPLDAKVIDPAWPSFTVTDDPLASTLKTQSDWAVKAKLIEQPDLAGIYDLTLLNKVLKAAGKPEVSDAGLGAK
nr:sulfate ABC transporter substrate-binding protein [Streptomyces sp. DSM 41633]